MSKRIPLRREFDRLRGIFLCQRLLNTYCISGNATNLVFEVVKIYIITMNDHTG